jgi:hypothetical protein
LAANFKPAWWAEKSAQISATLSEKNAPSAIEQRCFGSARRHQKWHSFSEQDVYTLKEPRECSNNGLATEICSQTSYTQTNYNARQA